MDGFILNHCKWFVILCTVMCLPYTYVWNFSIPKQTDKYLCSLLAYLVLMLVRVLAAKATGLPSWMRAAPRPYSLASDCITPGSMQSKYLRVVLSNVLHTHCLSEMLCLWMGSSPNVILVLKEMWSWKLNLEETVLDS